MKDDAPENKALTGVDEENKAPRRSKTVKVQINFGRAVTGLGSSGDVVEVDEKEATRLQEIGYAKKL